jgi:hypothetical protein
MRQTVRHQNLHSVGQLRHVQRQRIAHLDHRAQVLRPPLQHIGDILARMLAAGEVQGDLLALPGRNDTAGEHTGAFVTGLTLQLERLHAGVVVVYYLTLRRLPNQLIPRRFDQLGGFFDNLPLRRCR